MPMLSTVIALESYRSNIDSLPGTGATDIPERGSLRKKQRRRCRIWLPQITRALLFGFLSRVAEVAWCFRVECESGACFLLHGSGAGRARQNAFLYRASASLLPCIHIGSRHSLGPWSVIQAALQGGAATSRPSNIPCAYALAALLLVHSWAVVGVASDEASNSVAITCIIFIVRFLACKDRQLLRLAAAAHVTYLTVDVRIFLIKGLLRCRSRCGNIRSARLAVTYRRRPGSGRGFSRGQCRRCDRR
jgi:hypothetical protein